MRKTEKKVMEAVVNKVHPVSGMQNDNKAKITKFTIQNYQEKMFIKQKWRKKNEAEKKQTLSINVV